MSSAEALGLATCPLCGCFGARVTLSKKKLSCLTCNSSKCRGMQLFARAAGSDELVRDLIRADAPAPAPALPPAPAPEPDPVQRAKEFDAAMQHAAKTNNTGGGMGLLKWF